MRAPSKLSKVLATALIGGLLFWSNASLYAQESAVTVQVLTAEQKSPSPKTKNTTEASVGSNAVVWLTPVDHHFSADDPRPPRKRPRLTQRNKTFEPHLLVIEAGTTVDFPNKDPFFHNVFSLFDGKRFDLGLYEAGATNSARFERVGVSFIFCNIHPEMNAVVVAVDTPYFAVADRSGRVAFADVPDGRYQMHVWSERAVPDDLKKQVRNVSISSANRKLSPIYLAENPNVNAAHKNKYGQDYVAPPEISYPH